MDEITVNRIKDALLHMKVEAITFDGGMPLIDFGKSRLWIASVWRVINDGIIVANNDSKEAENLKILYGKSVQRVSIQLPLHDLELELSTGIRLETFSISKTSDHWIVSGDKREADMIIAGPGSSWSAF